MQETKKEKEMTNLPQGQTQSDSREEESGIREATMDELRGDRMRLRKQVASQAEQVRKLELDVAGHVRLLAFNLAEHSKELAQASETIAALQARIDYPWPIMGEGKVAVGQCRYSADNDMPGLIYLKLGAPRDIGADTGDIYPVGQPVADSAVLACVYFLTPEAIQQSIEILGEIQRDAFPSYKPPITSKRELELLAVIEQMREALTAIADPNSNHPIFFHEGSVSGMSIERMYEEIAHEALALTPDLNALKEHDDAIRLECAEQCEQRAIDGGGAYARQCALDIRSRMAEERRKP